MATSQRDTLITGLRNAYALEGQAISTMENVHDRLENYPELKAGVAQHLQETRQQQQMVERCLADLGEEPSSLKEMALKLTGNLQAMMHATAGDEVLKNLFALYAFEHLEIASYRSLVVMAEACGEPAIVGACRTILSQEEATAQKLERLIEPTTATYLKREAADLASASR